VVVMFIRFIVSFLTYVADIGFIKKSKTINYYVVRKDIILT
jgi:hypothetical protein